jgi:pimeloyl-ACP methyl ester carboxylesterase
MTDTPRERWVLLPGTLCTPEVFSPLLDRLGVARDQCRFITADAADVRDYAAPLQAAVTGGEVVCGFSLGALIAAHNLPVLARAKAVVLVAANPFPDPPGNRANREAVRDRVLAGGARDWVLENLHAMSTDRDPALSTFVADMAEETAPMIVAQTELAASRPGAARDIGECNLPLVFVTGSDDRMTPADALRPLVGKAQHADLQVLDGLGHYALIEAPDRVAHAFRQGLRNVLADTNQESGRHDDQDDTFHAA